MLVEGKSLILHVFHDSNKFYIVYNKKAQTDFIRQTKVSTELLIKLIDLNMKNVCSS